MSVEYHCNACERPSQTVQWLSRDCCPTCGRNYNQLLHDTNREEDDDTVVNWAPQSPTPEHHTREQLLQNTTEDRRTNHPDSYDHSDGQSSPFFARRFLNASIYRDTPPSSEYGRWLRGPSPTYSRSFLHSLVDNDYEDEFDSFDDDSYLFNLNFGIRGVEGNEELSSQILAAIVDREERQYDEYDELDPSSEYTITFANDDEISFLDTAIDYILTDHHSSTELQNSHHNYVESILNTLKKVTLKPTDPDAKDDCCICQDTFGTELEIYQLPCQHKYHGTCITRWLNLNTTCPICRYSLIKLEEEDGNGVDLGLGDNNTHTHDDDPRRETILHRSIDHWFHDERRQSHESRRREERISSFSSPLRPHYDSEDEQNEAIDDYFRRRSNTREDGEWIQRSLPDRLYDFVQESSINYEEED
ncbi:MAG: hypothetical protein EXX96DRAFT_586190 [Benjaminiella poitrasii]|nr:MAG: hypothetical protein EXX96DRAFT_586190 [Benjaminiella poitrasii]